MPRGRPRKNPLPVKTEIVKETKETKETKEGKLPKGYEFLTQAQYDKLNECDRCHKKIISGEKNINLTYLTNMAPWHRTVSLDRVCLCGDCGKELNTIIDTWLINNGKGIAAKWQLQNIHVDDEEND